MCPFATVKIFSIIYHLFNVKTHISGVKTHTKMLNMIPMFKLSGFSPKNVTYHHTNVNILCSSDVEIIKIDFKIIFNQ